MRGNRRDFNHWNYLGNEGWRYDDVLPLFKRSENQQHGSSEYHGVGGPLDVTDINPPNPASLAFVEAAVERGYQRNGDFNGAEQDGVGLVQVNIKDGKRASAATAFLNPIKNRPNLTIVTGARTTRLLFEKTRVVGVEYEQQLGPLRVLKQASAEREVIVSCGAVDSPKLLMLSGIGPADELRTLGITPVVDLPGVGENLQDHLLIAVGYRYRDGQHSNPPAAGSGEACLFLRSRPGLEAAPPDLQFHFVHLLFIDPGYLDDPLPLDEGFCFWPTLVKPQSRGKMSLRSADPADAPIIRANYLASRTDLQTLVEGVKIARHIVSASHFNRFRGEELAPGPRVKSDQEIRAYIRLAATTLFHPVGTCKMGHDRMAVVDPRLRVHGVQGLRVADASIMPVITSGNTHAPSVMIGEKAADMVKETMRNPNV